MNAGKTLFPMMMLALLAGCSSPSDRHADARAGEQPSEAGALARPSPPLLARRPILPQGNPAGAGKKAVQAEADAPAGSGAMTMRPPPTPPSVVNIPPPAYVPDLPPADGAADPQPFPDEVTRYMVDRDSCDHFRGEEAYDVERLAFLQENIAELCTGTDTRLAVLRQRYAQDPAVMAALGGYEDRIEGNASQ